MLGVTMCFYILASRGVQFMWGLADFKASRIRITYFKHFFVPDQVLQTCSTAGLVPCRVCTGCCIGISH